ncbi:MULTISPECIES: EamA family transporter RarD [Pontibacillus]|uniref:EamA family transporter RarD n=1 Tax=Pontibacillus chungwhensis TaxID=265426 RepID=A0ABY8UW86_9BACI|nr:MULTISPECIES: EamA family transporter RarD [Pontibacillus]MCD5323253.1 EamA family transporter RarD [Pontibacillus sp. HN14]WIF96639.1 EamA family transporter RarD [Pontibacillus chungwhensis]
MHNEKKIGILYTASAYILWGILPIYWKLIQEIPAFEILAHRIIWSCLFMFGIIITLRKADQFKEEFVRILANKKQMIGISLAAVTISINWVTYIWAVNSNHVVEASLGYYINPLVSIFLGFIVLKETFNKAQWVAIFLAAAGVTYMTWNFGSFPWVAILLAFSFGSYGLLKKMVNVGAMFGLTIETLVVTPIALLYLGIQQSGNLGEIEWISMTSLYVFGAGIVTAIPLLLFSSGAKRIPLSMVGFLQYFAPTIMLIIGVFVYNEPFTHVHLIAFTLIWSGLAIYTLSRLKRPRPLSQ